MFGERVQKIPIDSGLNCPNRDGTISWSGCIFCDARGSGTGAMVHQGLSVVDQILRGQEFAERRYGAKKFIAYFQSFSNTYGPIGQLKALYDEALSPPGMVGLSVATRPDCVNHENLSLLSSYRKNTLVWVEYGLQSAHDATLSLIRRGHDVDCFVRAVKSAKDYGLNICVHMILGLPGESREMMRETAGFLADLPIEGVKIHLLYVVKNTPLARMVEKGEYECLERSEYIDLVVDVLERLPPEIIIQRLTGDPMIPELVAPLWTKDKSRNINLIRTRLEERNTWQGRKYKPSTVSC
jgi:uncharacterized protein